MRVKQVHARHCEEHLLRPMLAHELQKQQRLVNMSPVLLGILEATSNHPHDLLVIVNVI